MAGFRSTFIHVCHPLARLIPPHILMKLSGQKLMLPVYHLISDHPPAHVRHLYQVKTIEAFERDLDYLLKYYEPLDLVSLYQIVSGQNKPNRPSFFLSFDDGLSEFYHVIAPILESRGVRAINFLNNTFIDNLALFYRYKVSLIIEKIKSTDGPNLMAIGTQLGKTISSSDQMITYLLSLGYADTKQIDALAEHLQLDFDKYLKEERPYLSTDQIKDLQARGFWFGAHSMDHPLFADLSLEQQHTQALESVRDISNRFNPSINTFAFPFTDYGIATSLFDDFYRHDGLMHLSFGSAGLKQDIYPQHLQRIPMEMGRLDARSVIQAEMVYFAVKQLLKKNKIERI